MSGSSRHRRQRDRHPDHRRHRRDPGRPARLLRHRDCGELCRRPGRSPLLQDTPAATACRSRSCRRPARSRVSACRTAPTRATTWRAPRSRRPPGMPAAITGLGAVERPGVRARPPRLPRQRRHDTVQCYNASTDASCVNFPKPTTNSSLHLHGQRRPGAADLHLGQRRRWQRADPELRRLLRPGLRSGRDPRPRGELRGGRREVPAGVLHLAGDPHASAHVRTPTARWPSRTPTPSRSRASRTSRSTAPARSTWRG